MSDRPTKEQIEAMLNLKKCIGEAVRYVRGGTDYFVVSVGGWTLSYDGTKSDKGQASA